MTSNFRSDRRRFLQQAGLAAAAPAALLAPGIAHAAWPERPVTVRQPPWSMPASSKIFSSGWMPPMRMSSDIM